MKTSTCCLGLLAIPSILTNGFQQIAPLRRIDSASASILQASSVLEDSPVSSDLSEEQTATDLPPVLQHIVDERNEFQLNLGKAMDTLRKDYPEILKKSPDFSIYHKDINVVDPSGVQLTGLSNYRYSFSFYQTIVKVLYSPRSGLQFRMVYDFARSSIRVSWNVVLFPKVPMARPLYVDGVSSYKLDSKSGKITEHRIENLIVNGTPQAPPYGIFQMMREEMLSNRPVGVPVGAGVGAV